MEIPQAPGKQMRLESYPTRNDALHFAKHTRKNLAVIEDAASHGGDVHVVTQLVNSLLGLVVFPWERNKLADHLWQQPMHSLTELGWPEWLITTGESRRLGDLLRHLRNAIAHGRLIFSSDSRVLEEVTITVEDYSGSSKSAKLIWQGEIRSDHLRQFCYRFIDFVEKSLG